MRPSSKPTGAVWRLLSEWSSNHPLRPNQSQMAGLFGVSTSLMSNWKFMESVMQIDDMQLVAEKTGIDFALIARAVAEDARKDVMGNAEHPAAIKRPAPRPAEQLGNDEEVAMAADEQTHSIEDEHLEESP